MKAKGFDLEHILCCMFKQPTHIERICMHWRHESILHSHAMPLSLSSSSHSDAHDRWYWEYYSTGCAETNKGKHISIYALNVGQSNKDHIMLAWLKMLFLLVSVFYCRIVSSLQNYRKIYFGYYHSCKEELDNVSGVQIYGHILWHCLYCLGRL